MGTIRSFRDLEAWRRGVELAVASYAVARRLPPEERFALGDQIRRSAVSVPANIAEGHARLYTTEYLHSLSHARGSLAELETLVQIAVGVSYVSESDATPTFALATHTSRLLSDLIRSLRGKVEPSRPSARRSRNPPAPGPRSLTPSPAAARRSPCSTSAPVPPSSRGRSSAPPG